MKILPKDIMSTYWVNCECMDAEHSIRLTVVDGEDDDSGWPPELSIDTQTSGYMSFWGRLWYSIKFVIAGPQMSGQWASTIVSGSELATLENAIADYRQRLLEWEGAQGSK